MEAFKIIKRIAVYLVFVVAAALFFYYSVAVALAPYLASFTEETNFLSESVYLPLMYAILSLLVLIFSQFLLIGKPKEIETNIYAWLLTIYFGVGLAAGVIIIAYGLVSLNAGEDTRSPIYLVSGMVPCLVLMFGEVVLGIICSVKNKKNEALEQKQAAEQEEKENAGGINLHKD